MKADEDCEFLCCRRSQGSTQKLSPLIIAPIGECHLGIAQVNHVQEKGAAQTFTRLSDLTEIMFSFPGLPRRQ
jgi:hypothetical protein